MAEKGSDMDSSSVENIGGLGGTGETVYSHPSTSESPESSLSTGESEVYYRKQMESWKELAENRGLKIEKLEKDLDEKDKHIARLNAKSGVEPSEVTEKLEKDIAKLKQDLEREVKEKEDIKKDLDARLREKDKLTKSADAAKKQRDEIKKDLEAEIKARESLKNSVKGTMVLLCVLTVLLAILVGVISTIPPCKCPPPCECPPCPPPCDCPTCPPPCECPTCPPPCKCPTCPPPCECPPSECCSEVEQLKVEIMRLQAENLKLQRENEQLKEENRQLREEIRELEKVIEDLQTRLSKCLLGCGEEVEITTENELSPFELAKQYRTLYEQDYTLAVDELEEKDGTSDVRETVKIFLDILKAAHSLASDYTRQHIESMNRSITSLQLGIPSGTEQDEKATVYVNSTLSKLDLVAFYELRLKCAWKMRQNLTTELGEVLAKQFNVDNSTRPKMVKYIYNCVEFCWKINMRPQPVYIDFYEPKGITEFDFETFKPFMHMTGNYLDYIVWPPLYEKSGGSMLFKGVAEKKD